MGAAKDTATSSVPRPYPAVVVSFLKGTGINVSLHDPINNKVVGRMQEGNNHGPFSLER